MLAGELYNPLDKVLSEDRIRTRLLIKRLNDSGEDQTDDRYSILRELIPNVGSITPNGFFVYFPRAHEKDLTFHVRMVLETQDGDVPSVEVPIVHERDFRTAPIVLIEVPNSAERRVMLRVYESTGGPRTVARIRVFASSGIEILSERVVSLSRGTVGGDEFPMYSGVAQMPLSDLIDLSTAPEQLRIEVTGESPEDLPIWAFASITENDTQHVTLITPQ